MSAFDVLWHVPIPTYVFRVEGGDFVLEDVNAAGRSLNPALASMCGHSITHLYKDQPQAIEDARHAVENKTTVVREMAVRRYNRTEATQLVRLSYVFYEPDHMVIFMQDIATPPIAEAALRESEARYRSLVASLPDGILLRGPDGRVLACNDVAVRFLGAQSQFELLGTEGRLGEGIHLRTESGEVVPQEDVPSLRVLRTGVAEMGTVYTLSSRDGATRWFRYAAQPIQSTGGAVTGSVTTLTDITEQRRLEEELRRAHRLESIGRLAGGVAHDFNNLLAAMMGSLELLEDQCPESARQDLATIRHGAERARDLTRQLLAFARKQPVEYKVVDLSALVREVERMLRRLVGTEIELSISLGDAVHVRADPSLLEQVLVNLVVNARDAMPEGGRLEMHVGRLSRAATGAVVAADYALLEVNDSGVGMDEDTRRRIFDPFFTTKPAGTGLGLASSYGIVKQHGGDIVVETRPGRGTRFRVLLPLLQDVQTRQEQAAPPPAPSGIGRVLVVDDEDLVRTTTLRIVRSLGYEVLSAASAEEALECAASFLGNIDVLLCDVAMPGQDGPSVAQELQKTRPKMRVLFVSGYASEPDDELLAGKAFLPKPYTRADLAARLRKLLDEG